MRDTDDLQWSSPRYEYASSGFIFMGERQVTAADLAELEDYIGGTPLIDHRSVVGRWHPEWSSAYYDDYPDHQNKPGGLGSHTYEVQKVNPLNNGAVEFAPEDQEEVFHYDPDHNFVHGKIDYPNTGRAFYRATIGTVAGPRAGSLAALLLGDGSYVWDSENKWWVID